MCVAFLALGATVTAQQQRVSVSIDLGWRFYYGTPNDQCNTLFNQNYTGQQCDGLGSASLATTPEACQDACCDSPSCQIWQFSNAPLPGGGCWIGLVPEGGCNPDNNWVSFANTSRPVQAPPFAAPGYDDSAWQVVDAPHDFIITGANASASPYDPNSDGGQAFIPKSVGAYRKHFVLPSDWQGTHIELYTEGVYASATFYLNGIVLGSHQLGYTSAFFRLDNVSVLTFGADKPNVLAVFVDATESQCTGWWYEGGGVFRHSTLTSSWSNAHVVPHGLHFVPTISAPFNYRVPATDGVTAAAAKIEAFADIQSDLAAGANVDVVFSLFAADSVTLVGSGIAKGVTVGGGDVNVTASAVISVANPELWSVQRPYQYILSAAVQSAGVTYDVVNVTAGLRTTRWDSNVGLFVNEQVVTFRGFCDHESFAAVGMAVPDRVNLFRMQAMRGMGGNSRRMSHNPPAPSLLDLTDALGVMVLDENRVFAIGLSPNMVDLVQRDRNHASIMFWSFCNEVGCSNPDKSAPTEPSLEFKNAVEDNDGTRAVTGNMCIGWGNCPNMNQFISGLNMSFELDVQGFSHVSNTDFEQFHAAWPLKPLVASECCSCETQRGEDQDLAHNASTVYFSNFNADCQQEQTNYALSLPYVAGTFVWTAFDYFGEPGNWPHISSSFGQFDLAGFPKAGAAWFRSWWLGAIAGSSPDRPPVPTTYFSHIVESWQANPSSSSRTVNLYSNAPLVGLTLNGAPVLDAERMPNQGWVRVSVPYAPGTLTLTGHDLSGNVVTNSTVASWGAAVAVVLTVDAPSPNSGTGSKLYLDGEDVALVRATIVDASGAVCASCTNEVTFTVTSGPALVWGTGNGDPSNHDPNHASSRVAYHGLVRAVIRTTQASAGSDADLALLAAVNVDAGAGPLSSKVVPLGPGEEPPSIVITATSPGLTPATITIPTSVDVADSVLAVATANVQAAYLG